MTIRAYLVDLDGTLYRPLPVKLGMALELALNLALGAWSSVRILRAFRHAHEQLRQLDSAATGTPPLSVADASLSPFERQLTYTAQSLALPSDRVRAVVTEWMFQRPRKWIRLAARTTLLQELAAFKRDGGKVAVVSDYPASGKLQALAALSGFDAIISNGEPGGPSRLKPDPEGYLLAATRLNVPADQCLVIGDRDDADGEAARRAGMQFRLVR